MRLVEDDAAVPQIEQIVGDRRACGNQARREEPDASGAALGCGRPDGAVFRDPAPGLLPPGARAAQERHQLALPLRQQVLGGQHQDGQSRRQGDELGGHAELHGLPEADIVGIDEARLPVDLDLLDHGRHERPLMRREAVATPGDGRLDERRLGLFERLPVG